MAISLKSISIFSILFISLVSCQDNLNANQQQPANLGDLLNPSQNGLTGLNGQQQGLNGIQTGQEGQNGLYPGQLLGQNQQVGIPGQPIALGQEGTLGQNQNQFGAISAAAQQGV